MLLTTSQVLQISLALSLCAIAFWVFYRARVETIVYGLVLLIPFQLVDTRFGTINVAFAYMVTLVLFTRGEIKSVPLPLSFSILFFAYFLSISQVHPFQTWDHLFYMASFGSAFAMMVLVYNFSKRTSDYRGIINTLHVMNVMVILYCLLQGYIQDDELINFGGGVALSIVSARTGEDLRLAGPFGSTMPGLLAEYLVICILFCIYDYVFSESKKKKAGLLLLIGANIGAIIATGNRGGLIGLIPFSFLLVIMLRQTLGFVNVAKILISASLIFLLASFVVIQYTDFNRVFDRLAETEVEGGVPDTRANSWPAAIALFEQKPWFGHGPRLKLHQEKVISIPDHTVINYPHNLYLFLLVTIGVVGLSAYLFFFVAIVWTVSRPVRNTGDPFLENWHRLAVLLVLYVLFDQIKIEFARYSATDYWHYLFMLFGLLVGIAHRGRGSVQANSVTGEIVVRGFKVTRLMQ